MRKRRSQILQEVEHRRAMDERPSKGHNLLATTSKHGRITAPSVVAFPLRADWRTTVTTPILADHTMRLWTQSFLCPVLGSLLADTGEYCTHFSGP